MDQVLVRFHVATQDGTDPVLTEFVANSLCGRGHDVAELHDGDQIGWGNVLAMQADPPSHGADARILFDGALVAGGQIEERFRQRAH